MKINVLHIINAMHVGGAETLLANSLACGGLQQNCNNILVFLGGPSHLLNRIDKDVIIINLNYTSYLKLPKILLQIRKIIKRYKIDIIHSHLSPVGSYTRFIAPPKIPLVHTLHIMYTHDKDTLPIFLKLDKKILYKHRNTALIFLSPLLQKDFLQAISSFKGKTFTLPNFVEDKFFELPTPTDKNKIFKIICIGANRGQKNYLYLFKIAGYLKGKNIEIDIYGGGDFSEFEKLIVRNKLPVHIKGLHQNISAILPEYNLFMMPSTFEGYPLSVIEAMASGLPCFLSNIPTLTDIGNDRAIFFNLYDAKKAAEDLIELSQNKIQLQTIARKGKDFANEEGKREKYVSKLIGIYNDILNSN